MIPYLNKLSQKPQEFQNSGNALSSPKRQAWKNAAFHPQKRNPLLVFVLLFSFFFAKQAKRGWLDGQTSTELTLTTFFINARHLVPSSATHNCASYGNVVTEMWRGNTDAYGYGKQKRPLPPLCLWLEPPLPVPAVVATGAGGGGGADGYGGGGGGGSCAYFCVTFQSISILCSQWRMTFVNVRHFRFPFQPQRAGASARERAACLCRAKEQRVLALPLKSLAQKVSPRQQTPTILAPTSPLPPAPSPYTHSRQLQAVPQDTEGGQRMSLTNLMSNIFVVFLIFFIKSIFSELELAFGRVRPRSPWGTCSLLGWLLPKLPAPSAAFPLCPHLGIVCE